MVGTSSDSNSLKEYLKKYTSNESNDDKQKKKKKKRKGKPEAAAAGVIVVDEDPIWQKALKVVDEEDSADEEKPQVDEDIDVKRMRRLEQLRSKRPYGVISEDGSGWISVSNNIPDNDKSENQSSNLSPPRRRRIRNDTPSPDPQQESDLPAGSDLSPPRQSHRKRYQSPSETKASSRVPSVHRHDTPSPEQHLKGDTVTDVSPPRRQQRKEQASSPEPPRRTSLHSKAMGVDISPPRRASKYQEDLSPPRKSKNDRPSSTVSKYQEDLSPPRKSKNDRPSSTVSLRKSHKNLKDAHVTADPTPSVPDLSPPRKRRKESPDSSRRPITGLVSGVDIKDEIDRKRKEDLLRFKKMDPSVSGRGAEGIYRNKITGERMSKEDFLKSHEKKKEEKPKEIKLEWGKGLAQKREAEARLQEMEEEKDKPFARSRDDPELDKMLKERVRWGDPMAHLVKNKQLVPVLPNLGDSETMKESGFIIPQEIPSHSWLRRGLNAAPNRYGIKPGRHWDGVDRSTGYENELFKRMNEKKATEAEAYLWSVADM
ncbi:hypothetical protein ACS0TY_012743 [Phlomoides rotata]